MSEATSKLRALAAEAEGDRERARVAWLDAAMDELRTMRDSVWRDKPQYAAPLYEALYCVCQAVRPIPKDECRDVVEQAVSLLTRRE